MSVLEIYESEKRKLKRSMVAVGIISMMASICLLAVPLYLFQVYDRVIFSRNLDTLIAISMIAVVVLLSFGFLDAIRNSLLTKIGVEFEAKLSGLLLGAELSRSTGMQRQSLFYLAKIRQVIASNVFPAFFDLPVMIVFVLIVFAIHPILGGVVVTGIVVLSLVALLSEVFTGALTKQAQEAALAAQRRADAAFRQHETVKAMGLYREIVGDWSQDQGRHLSKLVAAGVRNNSFTAASRTIRQIIQIALIGGGAYLVLQSHVTAGIIFAASMIGSRALAPVEQLIGGWRSIKLARLNFKLLEARLSTLVLPDGQTPLPRPRGRLVVDAVTYLPPGQGTQPILRSITGKIAAGSTTAIIGPSGAGKSTLAKCLIGYLTPTRGRVRLDGQDLQAWDPVTRGIYMGYLPQSVDFFDATVRENIARLRRNDDPELAVDAARFCGVHDMIMRFPAGYDTVISSDGFEPSGGQKQLLGLARAFYGNPSIVILDEPNANLDGDGERILHDCIRAAKKAGTTVVIVTQRTSVMRLVDNVLVLKNGAVESYGPPQEVLQGNISAFPRVKGIDRSKGAPLAIADSES